MRGEVKQRHPGSILLTSRPQPGLISESDIQAWKVLTKERESGAHSHITQWQPSRDIFPQKRQGYLFFRVAVVGKWILEFFSSETVLSSQLFKKEAIKSDL